MKKTLPLLLLLISMGASAQSPLDSLNNKVSKLDKLMNVLRKFRISGYIQPQFQLADTDGIASFSGGNFPQHSNNRFALRRGRFKVTFEHENAKGFKIIEAAFQLDATEKGVGIKDFYGKIVDPWIGWVGFKGGIFDRPFGFEVPYSSGTRETPERGRMSQTLFPGETGLGFALIVESPSNFKPVHIKIDAGLFSGTGISPEIDKRKDFIGHVQLNKSFAKNLVQLGVGASYYNGGSLLSTATYNKFEKDFAGIKRYVVHTIDSASINKKYLKREYVGADAQLTFNYAFCSTTLRGEFITGVQPGTSESNGVPTAYSKTLYHRPFFGAYAYFVQTFAHQLKNGHKMYHDFVFKYDLFDPNSGEKGRDISLAMDPLFTKNDIAYQTFGVGYIFRPYEWFKLMVYYDIVKNEKTNIAGYTGDLRDNVLTLRTQFALDTKWFTKQ